MENNIEGANLHTYVFIGRSGCGKGTQAKLLIDHLKEKGIVTDTNPIYYQETGSRFREFVTKDSYSSRLEKELMDKSERAPDFLAVWIWASLFIETLTGQEHLILDGSPRALLEAQMLETAFNFYGRKNVVVVYLDVSRAESKKRLILRGRPDDQKLGDIDKRLDWFESDVLPAVEYYRNNKKYKFLEVDGEQTIEKIHEDLVALLAL